MLVYSFHLTVGAPASVAATARELEFVPAAVVETARVLLQEVFGAGRVDAASLEISCLARNAVTLAEPAFAQEILAKTEESLLEGA